MDIVVKIIGVVIVFLAALFLIKPDIMRRPFEFFKQGKRVYIAGLVRLVLAVVFLLAARECDLTWVIVVLGILFLISGLSIFIIGAEKLKPMISWFQNKSTLFFRAMAVIVLAIGAIIIYSA